MFQYKTLKTLTAPARIHHDSPTKVSGNLGESVYLYCNTLGYPVPRVTWLRNESALQIDGHKYMQFGNNTLMITNLEKDDSGLYTCQVKHIRHLIIFFRLRFNFLFSFMLHLCCFKAYNGIGSPANWEVILLLDSSTSSSEQTIYPYERTVNPVQRPTKPLSSLGLYKILSI